MIIRFNILDLTDDKSTSIRFIKYIYNLYVLKLKEVSNIHISKLYKSLKINNYDDGLVEIKLNTDYIQSKLPELLEVVSNEYGSMTKRVVAHRDIHNFTQYMNSNIEMIFSLWR